MVKDDDAGKAFSGLSRRDFLRGGAAGAITTGVLSAGVAEGAPSAVEAPILGPGSVPVTLLVNGKSRRVQVEPRVTLLEVLRNQLDLTGTKKVCERGVCGACTVLLDGKPVYACGLLAVEAQGRQIQTIESFGTPEDLHPIQKAFVEHDAMQCGFCTPGFVVTTQALLNKHPAPTPEQIDEGLAGNVCRCGTYAGIRAAVLSLKGGKGGSANA